MAAKQCHDLLNSKCVRSTVQCSIYASRRTVYCQRDLAIKCADFNVLQALMVNMLFVFDNRYKRRLIINACDEFEFQKVFQRH